MLRNVSNHAIILNYISLSTYLVQIIIIFPCGLKVYTIVYLRVSFMAYYYIFVHTPSFFHQNSTILMTTVRTGRLHCRLSIASSIFDRIMINECIEGIKIPIVTTRNARSARKSHISFSRKSSLVFGHNPINSRLVRCSFIAHSKSSCRDFDEISNFRA